MYEKALQFWLTSFAFTSCVKSNWSGWGPCTSTCSPPLLPVWNQNRTRTKIKDEYCGGTCWGADFETRKCPQPKGSCCPVDCQVSNNWSSWWPAVLCDKTVTQVRNQSIVQNALCGGKRCPITRQTRKIKGPCCKVNCQYTWSDWSQCNATCGVGTRTRSPVITVKSRCGGKLCPSNCSQKCQRYLAIDCKARVFDV